MLRSVSTLSFEDLVAAFGPDAGNLPDGEAVGSSADDRPAVLDALGRSGWPTSPHLAAALDTEEHPTLAVHPSPTVQVNFFPGWGYVAFDIDLRDHGEDDIRRLLVHELAQVDVERDVSPAGEEVDLDGGRRVDGQGRVLLGVEGGREVR